MDIRGLRHWVERLADKTVLVVGDVILDEYLAGQPARLSREAPVPVLEFTERRLIPGGAANPSANIVALGSRAIQVGVVGDDSFAADLRRRLGDYGIDSSGIVTDPARPTTVKTRIQAHQGLRFPQQVARIDRIDRTPINGGVEAAVMDCIKQWADKVDAVLVSDYLSGLLTPAVVTRVRTLSGSKRRLLTADAQGELPKYARFDMVKCNQHEAAAALGRALRRDADFAAAGETLVSQLDLRRAMLITRGAAGMTIAEYESRAVTHLPQVRGARSEVFDTVGAGDTVIAVLTLALAAGASPPEAAMLANVAAGLVVRRVGNYAPGPEELLWALAAWAEA